MQLNLLFCRFSAVTKKLNYYSIIKVKIWFQNRRTKWKKQNPGQDVNSPTSPPINQTNSSNINYFMNNHPSLYRSPSMIQEVAYRLLSQTSQGLSHIYEFRNENSNNLNSQSIAKFGSSDIGLLSFTNQEKIAN